MTCNQSYFGTFYKFFSMPLLNIRFYNVASLTHVFLWVDTLILFAYHLDTRNEGSHMIDSKELNSSCADIWSW